MKTPVTIANHGYFANFVMTKKQSMTKIEEIWKDIKGYEGRYQISNLGRVKSLAHLQKHSSNPDKLFLKKERFIKLRVGTAFNGYSNIALGTGKQKGLFHHRVIAEAFIPNPDNKPFINHKNGIKTDNRIENLEWCTRSENAKHSFATGLQCNKGEKHPSHKVLDEDVLKMRKYYEDGYSTYAIYRDLYPCLSYTTVKDIIAKRLWKHI